MTPRAVCAAILLVACGPAPTAEFTDGLAPAPLDAGHPDVITDAPADAPPEAAPDTPPDTPASPTWGCRTSRVWYECGDPLFPFRTYQGAVPGSPCECGPGALCYTSTGEHGTCETGSRDMTGPGCVVGGMFYGCGYGSAPCTTAGDAGCFPSGACVDCTAAATCMVPAPGHSVANSPRGTCR